MKRWLSDTAFKVLSEDFSPLVDQVRNALGELDLRLRDGYINLYYRGNSAAKIVIAETCKVTIHKKFIDQHFDCSKLPQPTPQGSSLKWELAADQVRLLLKAKNIECICRRIYDVDYSEELAVEFEFIRDNRGREDVILIDRQITDSDWRGRADVLGLRKDDERGGAYRLVLIEVKRGEDRRIGDDVAQQMKRYRDLVEGSFDSFKECYEQVYKQMHALGLLPGASLSEIQIVRPVEESLVVIGYSGIAAKPLEDFRRRHPEVPVQQLRYLWQNPPPK